MNQLTKEVLKEIESLKKRDQGDIKCTPQDFEVLFLASLLEEEGNHERQ